MRLFSTHQPVIWWRNGWECGNRCLSCWSGAMDHFSHLRTLTHPHVRTRRTSNHESISKRLMCTKAMWSDTVTNHSGQKYFYAALAEKYSKDMSWRLLRGDKGGRKDLGLSVVGLMIHWSDLSAEIQFFQSHFCELQGWNIGQRKGCRSITNSKPLWPN